MPEPMIFTRYFPETDDELARKSYALYVYMIICLVEELSLDLACCYEGAVFTEHENESLNLVVDAFTSES